MSDVLPAAGAPYHRLARAPSRRRLRPILGVVVLLVAVSVVISLVAGVLVAIYDPEREGLGPRPRFEQLWELGRHLLSLGAAVPAVLLVARWVDRRPPGSVSSVAGRVRWRWLGKCMLMAAGMFALYWCVFFVIEPPDDLPGTIDWELVAGVALVGVALLPLQAAAEEYLFRGYLAQAAGVYLSNPWVPAVVLSLLFGLMHGTEQETWAFVDRVGLGLVAAWLTIRTGGLEAAIALHAATNFFVFIALAGDGELGTIFGQEFGRTPLIPDVGSAPVAVTITLTTTAAIGLLISRVAHRDRIQTAWAEIPQSPRRDS